MTEQLLTQQLESPSGTGRVEPRVTQPDSPLTPTMGPSRWTNPFSLTHSALPKRNRSVRARQGWWPWDGRRSVFGVTMSLASNRLLAEWASTLFGASASIGISRSVVSGPGATLIHLVSEHVRRPVTSTAIRSATATTDERHREWGHDRGPSGGFQEGVVEALVGNRDRRGGRAHYHRGHRRRWR